MTEIQASLSTPHHLIIQQILDLFTKRVKLSEEDLRFAITQIMKGNDRQSNGRLANADLLQQPETFDSQSPELQEFMLQTAVLPQSEMTPKICNALLKINNAEAHLQAMTDNNLLGNPAFAEFLRHKLKQDQAAYQELCLKAAHTLEAQTRSKKAIGLYMQARAWRKAAWLLETYGHELYDRGQAWQLYEWLEQMDTKELAKWPWLLLLKGKILNNNLGKPEKAISLFEHIECEFLRLANCVGVAESLVWQSVALRMMGQALAAIDLANKGLNKLNGLLITPDRLMAWAIRNRGLAYLAAGQTSEALIDLQKSRTLFEKIGYTYYIAMCHHDIGVCLKKQAKI